MDLDELNQWLLLVANVCVFFGILFLAYEVRQNSEALRSGSRHGWLEADLAILDKLWDHPDIYRDGMGPDIFVNEDPRHSVFFVSVMRCREFAWHQYRNGAVDLETFESYMAPKRAIFSSEPGRAFVERDGYAGHPEFQAFLKDFLSKEG